MRLVQPPSDPCPKAELISPFHDGELSPEREAEVRAHIASCADCQAILLDLQKISAAFAAAPLVKLSAKARARLEDALLTPPWVRMLLPVARPFAAAAMLMIALGIPVLIGSASTKTADAAALLPTSWETEATALTQDTSASTQTQFATWIVTDLATARK